MNKYLLLRDNKQSGPYTVPEIIAKGIKPYDLVWLEGKSAAWRYPSEVEELKAYAPEVEEQPFDRFYKRPDSANYNRQNTVKPETHSRFEPKISVETVAENDASHKKVYVNFPATAKPAATSFPVAQETFHESTLEIKEEYKPETNVLTPIFPERGSISYASEKFQENTFSGSLPQARSYKKDSKFRKLLYGVIAACLFLAILSVTLLVNYNQQLDDLKELNTIVQKMENNEKVQEAALIPPIIQTEHPQDIPAEIETVTKPLLPSPEKSTSLPLPSNKKSGSDHSSEASVVFKETTPADQPEPPKSEAKDPKIISSENLFKLVSIKPNEFKTGLLGGISNLQFELTNNSPVELHRVAVEIKYLGPEKKVVRKQTVYFENVAPGIQATIDVPKSNRGVNIEYTITDIKS